MSFDISLKFSVETGELINARNALQSLSQVANELNNNQNKAAAAAERLVAASDSVTKSSSKAAKATKDFSDNIEEAGDGSDKAEKRLQRLKDQLGYLNGGLIKSETGLTKMQAGMMASMKAIGATQTQLQEFSKVFDQFNKITGNSPFDKSAKGMAMLTNELRELERSSQLVSDGITLTSQQTKMLTRDLEALKQQNEALGKASSEGASEYERAFIEKAKAVNNLRAVAAEAEREEKERAKQAAAIAKEEERFYAAAAKEYEEQERRKTEALQREEAKRLAIIENARKSVNDKLMNEWASGVGVKSPELSKMASGYEQEMKAQAAAAKVAADAINYLEQEQRKLAATTELMARGFTAASANALYKYKEALEATGASAMDVKQKLYLFEQDLIKRQDKSPFAQMRKDIKQVQEDTNHLARAISVQLGDVAVSLAGGMNPFLVMIQQGDQIRFAVQQAKDAGQDLSKVMQGAFASMFTSFKLVYDVVKEFAVDGMRTLTNSFSAPIKHMIELHRINNQLSSGLIDSAKAAELKARSSELLAGSMRTLNLVIRGGVLAAIALLAAAYVSLSREQDKVAKMNAQFGASFGATTQEALVMARGLREFGVSTAQAVEAMSGLMKAGKIGKESFQGIAVAASEANKWVGISIEETIKKFNELADDPMKVLSEFTIQTGYLSQAQLQLVRDHLEAGDSAKAQAEAIKLLEDGYRQMASQAKQDMSDLGVAMNDLKDTTNTLWDAFKNSSSASAGIAIVTGAVKTLASAAIGALFGIKSIATALIFLNDVAPVNLAIDAATGGPSVASKFAAFKSSLSDNAVESRKLLNELWGLGEAAEGAASGAGVLTEEQKKQRSEAEETKKKILELKDAYKQSNNEYAKTVDVNTYVAKRLTEENEKMLKGATLAQRGAFFTSKEYHDASLRAQEKFTKEWEDANKKSAKSVASTYKVARDNELTEIKKFQDVQLKGLKDFEQKKSQVNKSAYDSRMISLGKYLAKEISLVQNSKAAQEAIISESEAKYRAELQQQISAHEAAAEAAIKAGGSRKAITEQLTQQIQNLNNAANSTVESFKQQREALENATDAKYAKFYEEIAKQVNASNDALEKFNESVDENARKRKESLDTQRALLGLHGAEAEAYKASSSAMGSYRKAIEAADTAFKNAKKSREDFQATLTINSTQQEFDAYNALLKAEEEAKKNSIATLEKAQVDSNKAAMDAIEAYNLEVFKEIRDALSEDIYNALFEGGKSGGDALKSVLKKMFKNYVINVILNPIMGNIVGGVMGAFGFGGAPGAQQFGGGGSLDFMNLSGSLGGTIASIGSKFGIQAAESFGMGLQGITLDNAIAGTYGGTAFNLGSTIGGWDKAISKVPGFEGGFGSVLGYGKAIFDLAEGNYGSAIGTAVGTYILPGIGTVIGSTLGGLVDGMFGGGTPHVGASSKYSDGGISASGAKFTSETGVTRTYEKAMQAPIDVIVKALGGSLDAISELFGGKRGFSVTAGFSADNDDPSAGLLNILDPNGDSKVRWTAGRFGSTKYRRNSHFSSDPKKGFDQYLQSVTADSIPVFKDLVPKWAGGMLDALTDSLGITEVLKNGDAYAWKKMSVSGEQALQALQDTLNAIALTEQGFKQLGQTMSMFSGISDDMKTALLGAFGSIQGVAEVAGNYYQNFYSEEERFRKAGETVNEALKAIGVELDVFGGEAAKVKYRELVEKAFAEGDNELAAQLLQMSDAFAEVADAAQGAIPAIDGISSTLTDYTEALANLEEKAGYLGSTNRFAATKAAGRVSSLFSGIGIEKEASTLIDTILDATASDVEDFFRELWPLLESDEAREELIAVSDALLDVAARSKELKLNLATLMERMGDTDALRNFNLDEVSRELVTFGKSIGKDMDIDNVKKQILGANKEAVKAYFNDVWQSLDTTEAQQKFIGITNSILDVVESTEKLSNAQIKAAREAEEAQIKAAREAEEAQIKLRAQAESMWNAQLDSARKVVEAQIDLHEREAAAIRERIAETEGLLNQLKSDRDWFVLKAGRNAGQAGVPSSPTLSLELASTWEEYAAQMGYMADLTDDMVSEQQAVLDELKKAESRHTESIKNLQGIITESQKQTTQLMSLNEAIDLLRTDSETGIQKLVDALSNKASADSVVKGSYNAIIKVMKEQHANAVSAFAGDETAAANFFAAMHDAGITMFDDVANHSIKIYDKEIERLQGIVDGIKTSVSKVNPPATAPTGPAPVNLTPTVRGNKSTLLESLVKAIEIPNLVIPLDPTIKKIGDKGGGTGSTPSGEKTLESVSGLTRAEWEILDSLNMEYLRLTKGEAEVRKAQIAALGKPELQDAQRTVWTQEILNSVEDQMKGLEEVGQLTSIKEGVSELITSITAIGASSVHQLEDSISKVQELGAAQLNKARKELYNQLLPEQEITKLQLEELSAAFEHLGFVMPATAQGFRAILDSVADGDLRDSLLELVPAFTALGNAADDALDALQKAIDARIKELEKTFTATDLALKVLEKAVEQQKKALTEQLDGARKSVETLKKVFDTLDNGIKNLRKQVESSNKLQVFEARELIDTARASGVIPDPDKLSEAVATLTTSVEGGLYATEYDKSRAFLTLANDLENLNAIAEPQLTEAEATVVNLEKQIKQLDELLNDAKTQVENLRKIDASLYGIDESITDVQAAMNQLQTAVKAEEQARSLIEALNKQLEDYQRQIDAINGVNNSVLSVEEAIRNLQIRINSATPSSGGSSGYVPSEPSSWSTSGGPAEVPSTPSSPTVPSAPSTSSSLSPLMQYIHAARAAQEIAARGVPSYDVGTNYVPNDMLANIHEGEMIVPKKFNPSTSGLNNAELIAEVKALRDEVVMLRAETRATALNTSKTSRILDDVTQGGNSLKTTNV